MTLTLPVLVGSRSNNDGQSLFTHQRAHLDTCQYRLRLRETT